jgi:hypothetical protein
MTVIRPNSIAGITSITAQGENISFYSSDGVNISQFNANINASNGVSTIANANVTGVTTTTTLAVNGISTSANLRVTGVTTSATLAVTGVGTFTSVGVATANPITRFQVGSATTQSVFITSTGNVGLASTNPRVSLDASQETDAIALPQGTTAQRPSGSAPYIRYNTSNSALEFYNGTDWVEIISDYFPSGSTILG